MERRKSYSKEFKMKVVNDSNMMKCKEAAKLHGVHPHCVYQWRSEYNKVSKQEVLDAPETLDSKLSIKDLLDAKLTIKDLMKQLQVSKESFIVKIDKLEEKVHVLRECIKIFIKGD